MCRPHWSVTLVAGMLMLLVLNGCFPFSTSQVSSPVRISLRDLLIDKSVYPSGWVQEQITAEDPDDEIENLHIGFRYQSEPSTVSIQVVLRYSSQAEARQGFETLLNHDKSLYGDLSPRQELVYRSSKAQNTSILCSNRSYSPTSSLPPLCITMAQYDSYISVFSAPIDNRVMSYADYELILREIDKRMAKVADQ